MQNLSYIPRPITNRSHGRREVFIVSASDHDPAAGNKRLKELEDVSRKDADADLIRSIDSGKPMRTVVLSCSPTLAQRLAMLFPDLIIEKNEPLRLF